MRVKKARVFLFCRSCAVRNSNMTSFCGFRKWFRGKRSKLLFVVCNFTDTNAVQIIIIILPVITTSLVAGIALMGGQGVYKI